MTYRLKTKSRNRWERYTPYLVGVGALLIIVLLNFTAPRLFSPLVRTVAVPFIKVKNDLGYSISDTFTLIHSKEDLQNQVNALQLQVNQDHIAMLQYGLITQENDDLKAVLGRVPQPKDQLLAAVLSAPPVSPYDTFLIDAGGADGLKAGDMIETQDGVLVGTIAQVNSHTSLAQLYSTPGQQLQVTVGTSTIAAVATGEGGTNMQIRLPQNANVRIGDPVMVPGLEPQFIGSIGHIDATASDSFETIFFTLPVSLSQTQWLLIDKSPIN
jgi:cell shape-determining protein MreC